MFPTPIYTTDESLDPTDSLDMETVSQELQALARDQAEFDALREYYEGEQTLKYGTQKFRDTFGPDFKEFSDNWCQVVVDAVNDRLSIEGVRIGENDETQAASAKRIWEALRNNDFDEQQRDAHEAGLVEGKFYVIVWPDELLGARVDWNLPQLVRVRYADDDERRAVLAVKRWRTPAGEIWVNVLTPSYLYKYKEETRNLRTGRRGALDSIPSSGAVGALVPRETDGEEWPVVNPMGVVPVVEFNNKRGSELSGVVPQQDAINYMLIQSMVGGEFASFKQKVMLTGVRAPSEGWSNKPGTIWRLPPMVDGDGKLTPSQIAEFSSADLGGFRTIIDMLLMHTALTSKTPVRYFFQSDRGGRGDAPSGESLKHEDGPLLSKIEDRQVRFGNKWYQVCKLVALALDSPDVDEPIEEADGYANFLTVIDGGEVIWASPENAYQRAVLEEAVLMMSLGLPRKFIWTKLGFGPEEIAEAERLYAEEQEERRLEAEAALAAGSDDGSGDVSDPAGSNGSGGSGESSGDEAGD